MTTDTEASVPPPPRFAQPTSAPRQPSFAQTDPPPLRFGFTLHGMGGHSQSRGTLCAAQDDAALGGFGVFASWETPDASAHGRAGGHTPLPPGNGGFRLDAAALYSFGRHDLRLALPASLRMPALAGRVDTHVFRAEARASYAIHAGSWRITPHVGMRFTALRTGAHDLGIPEGSVVAFSPDTQDMASFPLGLGLTACMDLGGWQVSPSADFAFVPMAGSAKTATSLRFSGLDAEDLARSRVADASGFEATLAVEARHGALALSLQGRAFLSRHEEDAALSFSLRWRF